jgi:hypothetical protein
MRVLTLASLALKNVTVIHMLEKFKELMQHPQASTYTVRLPVAMLQMAKNTEPSSKTWLYHAGISWVRGRYGVMPSTALYYTFGMSMPRRATLLK